MQNRKSLFSGMIAALLAVPLILGALPGTALTARGAEAEAGLVIEGGKAGSDYTYEKGVLTFLKDGAYTVRMAEAGQESGDRIRIVQSEKLSKLDLTLESVKLNAGGGEGGIAIDDNGYDGMLDMSITFSGENRISADNGALTAPKLRQNITVRSAGGKDDMLTLAGGQGRFACTTFTQESGTVILDQQQLCTSGDITLNDGSLTISADGCDAVYTYGKFLMNGGTLDITSDHTCIFAQGRKEDKDASSKAAAEAEEKEPEYGVQFSGGSASLKSTAKGYGAISAGSVGRQDVLIDTDGAVNIESVFIGILLHNGSSLTMNKGLLNITGPILGIWPYNGSTASTLTFNGGDTEISASSSAIRLDKADVKSVSFGEDYEHKTIAGTEASLAEETADDELTDSAGLSGKYAAFSSIYKITYDLDGGALAEDVSNPETYTRMDEITLNAPVKKGFTFSGWTGTGLSKAAPEVVIAAGSTGDREYKAVYAEEKKTSGNTKDAAKDAAGGKKDAAAQQGTAEKPVMATSPNTEFSDVKDPSHEYYKAVSWAASGGLDNGYEDGRFGVDDPMTRGQAMLILWRLAGMPEPKGTSQTFSDVPAGSPYFKALQWGRERGIATGHKDGSFGVEENCTRGHAMVFLWRVVGKIDPAGTKQTFSDVPADSGYFKPVQWNVENGIAKGQADGTFGVNTVCTRGEFVNYLYLFMQ
ncbi:MAG: S-layer homology domain-containing protein [Lachnospiraceae bacterium]|nr:S-layer homology domain-containing protein [Lachnospiraceae bacterium]